MADGLDNLIRLLGRLDASGRAGIMDDEENASKLTFAEFGTVTAPPRPTMGPAYDEQAITEALAGGMRRAVDGAARGGPSTLDGQSIVGEAVEALADRIRGNIESNTPPPLAESTIRSRQARGNSSTATLIDTGKMRGAVRSETRRGSKGWPE